MIADNFDPNGVGLKNGNFIGLPFEFENSKIVLFPVPWDVTVSYSAGTSLGPQNILNESVQLDLHDIDVENAWRSGIYFQEINQDILNKSQLLREKTEKYIDFIENGGNIFSNSEMLELLNEVNSESLILNRWIKDQTSQILDQGKLIGLIGGDHSTPLGYYEALAGRYADFGILHIDAHMDLRNAYEGFVYSHASVFYNALKIPNITKLVQVGIRDYCQAEVQLVSQEHPRVEVYFDHYIKSALYRGERFADIVAEMISNLPDNVYVSFDIDGLDPKLCPSTGTPVPGGFEFSEVCFIFEQLVESGKRIIGFDVVETGSTAHPWDGNVAARIVYKLATWMAKSQNII
jgi:agmatinase